MAPNRISLTEKWVTSRDGTKLFAEACGTPTKPALVFVHGFACAGVHFDRLFDLEEMQDNAFLVRWDMRAHGRTEKPLTLEAYESARFGEDFDAVCNAFNVRSPTLVGWSAGGSIAADIFAHSQTKPVGVVLVGGSAYNAPGMQEMFTPLCAKAVGAFIQPDTSASEAFKTVQEFCEAFVAPGRISVPYSVMNNWIGIATQFPPQCAALFLRRQQNPSHLLKAAAGGLPLCIISGKEDLLIRGNVVVEKHQTVFNRCEVHLLDDIGHIPFWEEPTAVAKILLTFVAQPNQGRKT